MEWEERVANISDKRLVCKIHRLLLKLNSKETNNSVSKWAKYQIDISLQMTYKWPTDMWKWAQYHWSLENKNQNHSEKSTCTKDFYYYQWSQKIRSVGKNIIYGKISHHYNKLHGSLKKIIILSLNKLIV